MSGGAAVKAGGGVEGDRPVCTTLFRRSDSEGGNEQKQKTGGRPGIRPADARRVLALTAPGPQAPLLFKKAGMNSAEG